MSASRLADALVGVALVGVLAVWVGLLTARPASASDDRFDIHVRYSHYEPAFIAVPAGEPVTIVLHNDDPIEHEWIIGGDALHERHRTGTEEHHGERPTEVSIPALSTIETTVTFADPISWQFICHLPGHEAYGMVGVLEAR